MVTIAPRRIGRDIGPDEKYREGFWDQAILERGDYIQSDGLPRYQPRYQQVFIPGLPGQVREEPMDESEEPFDGMSIGIEGEEEEEESYAQTVPDFTTLYSESDRLKTFAAWKRRYHATPSDLARNGFVYRGPEDRVTCVFCRHIIYRWEKGDVVEEEHRRISPDCPFLHGDCDHLNKPISSADRLRESFGDEPLDTSSVEIEVEESDTTCKPSHGPINLLDYSTSLDISSERDRLKTFGPWKQSYHASPLDLARNGFVYRGPEDRVTCVFCRRIIHRWEEGDVVEKEHRRISPNCPFLNGERDYLNQPILL